MGKKKTAPEKTLKEVSIEASRALIDLAETSTRQAGYFLVRATLRKMVTDTADRDFRKYVDLLKNLIWSSQTGGTAVSEWLAREFPNCTVRVPREYLSHFIDGIIQAILEAAACVGIQKIKINKEGATTKRSPSIKTD